MYVSISSDQISEGPNPAIDDLSPDKGNVTFPVGHAVAQFTLLIRDDQVKIIDLLSHFKRNKMKLYHTYSSGFSVSIL